MVITRVNCATWGWVPLKYQSSKRNQCLCDINDAPNWRVDWYLTRRYTGSDKSRFGLWPLAMLPMLHTIHCSFYSFSRSSWTDREFGDSKHSSWSWRTDNTVKFLLYSSRPLVDGQTMGWNQFITRTLVDGQTIRWNRYHIEYHRISREQITNSRTDRHFGKIISTAKSQINQYQNTIQCHALRRQRTR